MPDLFILQIFVGIWLTQKSREHIDNDENKKKH